MAETKREEWRDIAEAIPHETDSTNSPSLLRNYAKRSPIISGARITHRIAMAMVMELVTLLKATPVERWAGSVAG